MTAETAVEEAGHPQQVGIRVAPGGAAARRVEALLGHPLPPPNTATGGVLWLGPDEWLLVDRGVSERELRELASGDGAAVELSANRLALLVHGPAAGDVLAGCCSLDLHPRSFPTGCCAQTLVAGVPVIVERIDERPGFRLLVRPSFAEHVRAWLHDSLCSL